jgi:hypothetical protein
MTTSHEARELRDRIYSLYLKRLTVREIGKSVGRSISSVSRQLAAIRNENIAWFEASKDPEGRQRAFYKELADQLDEIVKEGWVMYGKALKELEAGKHGAFGACNAFLHTILEALRQYRLHLRMVAPNMDDLYVQQQLKVVGEEHLRIEKYMEEQKMRGKVLPVRNGS